MAEFQTTEPIITSDMRIISSRGLLLAYFAVHSEAHGVLGNASHLHHILAPIALFLCSGSLSPIPPAFLGKQTLSHLTRAHLWLGHELPHKKLRWRFFISLRTHLGTAVIEKIYKGMEWRIALIRKILLAILRALWVQRKSLASSFSSKSFQEECLRAEAIRGAPRYLEGRRSMENPRIWPMDFWVEAAVLKKKIWDDSIDEGSRGIREGWEDCFEKASFLDWGMTENHVIIHKLLVGEGRRISKKEAFETPRRQSRVQTSAQSFFHDDKEER